MWPPAELAHNDSLEIDTLLLLRQLTYLLKGSMKIKTIKNSRYVTFNNDPRVILSYCQQASYIKLTEDSIELTDCGFEYYQTCQNNRQVW